MKIGCPAPRFRVPAVAGGTLTYLDSASLRGRSIALCFLPPFGLLERPVLEHHVQDFEDEKAFFLGVVDEGAFFFGPWQRDPWFRGLTLTGDPLGRLSRSFGISHRQSPARCQSFVIDPKGILRYHLVHDLNGRGMNALLEVLKACRPDKTPQPTAPRSAMQDSDERVQPLLATSTQGE